MPILYLYAAYVWLVILRITNLRSMQLWNHRKFDISSVELLRLNPELKNGVKAGMVIKIPIASEEVITQNIRQPEEREVNALLSTPKDIKKVNRIQVALCFGW